jgi:hypothetical protein
LRHSFASHLVEVGVGLHTAKSLLGHKNINTTMIYLHLKVKRERVAVHTGRPLLIGAFQLPQPKPAPARKCPCCGAPMLRVMTFLAPWQSCRAPPPPKKRRVA